MWASRCLLNKLTGRRTAIVEDTPGVTRDRIYGECEWCGRSFRLVDTGGIEPGTDSEMLQVHAPAGGRSPLRRPDVIVMVVDVRPSVLTAADAGGGGDAQSGRRSRWRWRSTSADQTSAASTRRPMNSTVLGSARPDRGLGGPWPRHGRPAGLPAWRHFPADDRGGIRRRTSGSRWPSWASRMSGKSSLVNRILGEERVIVSDVAGTTRDAIDSEFENEFGKYVLIDTAGMRRKSKVDDAIERYSNMRSISAIERADVCLDYGRCQRGRDGAGYQDCRPCA